MENEILRLHQRFCDYSLTFKGNTPRTIQWYRSVISAFIRHTKLDKIESVTQGVIEGWILDKKLKNNWSAKTIRNNLQGIGLFFDWCVNQGFVQKHPTKDIPKPRLPKTLPKHLSKEESTTLLDWTRNFPYSYKFDRTRAVAVIATFMYTGIRLQELKNLKMTDVDLERHSLFVQCGKGEKDRNIPLNLHLLPILEEYLKDRKRLKKTCPYFFTAMRDDKRMGDLVIKRLIEKLRKKSGIYFYPHLLRHTFATLMLEGGCDLFSLSKMMGHSDIKTTTIYLSATTAHLQEQILKHPLNF